MCVCVCVYVCMCVRVFACLSVYLSFSLPTSSPMQVCVCTHACMYVRMHVCMRALALHACMYACGVGVFTFVSACTHAAGLQGLRCSDGIIITAGADLKKELTRIQISEGKAELGAMSWRSDGLEREWELPLHGEKILFTTPRQYAGLRGTCSPSVGMCALMLVCHDAQPALVMVCYRPCTHA